MKSYSKINTLYMYRVLYSFQEPTLPVYLQRTWGLNSSQVGLVFFGAALPATLGQSHCIVDDYHV
jgi:hypothetical protein